MTTSNAKDYLPEVLLTSSFGGVIHKFKSFDLGLAARQRCEALLKTIGKWKEQSHE